MIVKSNRIQVQTDASDIDIICHWLSPETPVRVSSFGSLQHFRKEEKPADAGNANRCLDCPMERDCAYSAKKGARMQLVNYGTRC